MEKRIREVIARVNPKAMECKGIDLIEEIGIDSHDIFNIVVELEEEFDIEIDPTFLKAENFSSFKNIEKMINELN